MAGRNSYYEGKIAGLYDLDRTLGKGHFAVVKLARHVFTGEKVAVKVIDKTKLDKTAMGHLLQEVRCMKLVQHPNVVRLYEVIDTQTKLYLILELGDGGDMFDYIMKYEGGLSEEQAKVYFAQIVHAISYCHKLHVVHRDLKPENVVFFKEQGVVKLTDFGFSNHFQPGKMLATSCGSLAYSAPEILLGDEYEAPSVDIWSLGVILYMLVCGSLPFQEANDSETLTMILDCRYTVPDHISQECTNLISWMLQRDPKKRASLEHIESHPWLQGVDPSPASRCVLPLTSYKSVSQKEHEVIIQAMTCGNIADKETIQNALEEDQYNHITATYFLLAERILREKQEKQTLNQNQNLNIVYNWANQIQSRQPLSETFATFGDARVHSTFSDVGNGLRNLQLPRIRHLFPGSIVTTAHDACKSDSDNSTKLASSTEKATAGPASIVCKDEPSKILHMSATPEVSEPRNSKGLHSITEEEEEEEEEETEDDIMEVASRESSQDLVQELSQNSDVQNDSCLNSSNIPDANICGIKEVLGGSMYGREEEEQILAERERKMSSDSNETKGQLFSLEIKEDQETINGHCVDRISRVFKVQKTTAGACSTVKEEIITCVSKTSYENSQGKGGKLPTGLAITAEGVNSCTERHNGTCNYQTPVLLCDTLKSVSDGQICKESKDSLTAFCNMLSHNKSHLCVFQETKSLSSAGPSVKNNTDDEVCVSEESKSHDSPCDYRNDIVKNHSSTGICEDASDMCIVRTNAKVHSECSIGGTLLNMSSSPVYNNMKCHNQSHLCEELKNLMLVKGILKNQSESCLTVSEKQSEYILASDSVIACKHNRFSMYEGLHAGHLYNNKTRSDDNHIFGECRKSSLLHDSYESHRDYSVGFSVDLSNFASAHENCKGQTKGLLNPNPKLLGQHHSCMKISSDCKSDISMDYEKTSLEDNVLKKPFKDIEENITKITEKQNGDKCCKRKLETEQCSLQCNERQQLKKEHNNNNGCAVTGSALKSSQTAMAGNSGTCSTTSTSLCCMTASANVSENITLKNCTNVDMKYAAGVSHRLPGATSSESSKELTEEINTTCSDSSNTCAENCIESVIKTDPAKNKNQNLRNRLLQFPLCEKALAFKIKPNSQENLLPFGQFNCCHVI
ncbi:uncharacterized protein LOC122809609 [Protopterus annectens]|uniref:uncharacterized protein LOC122809609 n=1 Tax=Protopterus annectens TaxID=7888 RepID=UPI001CFC13E4|nr:uncharacterized protein LOC122809609 [Protopterus annectens]